MFMDFAKEKKIIGRCCYQQSKEIYQHAISFEVVPPLRQLTPFLVVTPKFFFVRKFVKMMKMIPFLYMPSSDRLIGRLKCQKASHDAELESVTL